MARKPRNPKWEKRWFWKATDYDRVVPVVRKANFNNRLYTNKAVIRNLGVAIVKCDYDYPSVKRIAVYAHSSVTNAHLPTDESSTRASYYATNMPHNTWLLDKEAAENLAAMLIGAIQQFDTDKEV